LVAHLQFFQTPKAKQKTAKELPSQRTAPGPKTNRQAKPKEGQPIIGFGKSGGSVLRRHIFS